MTRPVLLDRASAMLASLGLRVLDRAWDSPEGTLDVVASDRDTLVAVVVFGRQVQHPFLSRARHARTRRLAVAWMTHHGVRFDRVRVDVVMITVDGVGGFTTERVADIGPDLA
jgi:putative endonuclease